jgi:MFS family permease
MLAPRFAVDVLGIAAADAVFVMAPAGVGILIAVVVLSRQPPGTLADRQRLVTMGLAVVSVALGCVAGLPAIGRFFGVLRAEGEALDVLTGWDTLLVGGVMLSALIAGFGFAAVLVASQTLLQERAPVSARGRVFAVQFSLANLFSVIPLLSIGGLADVVGVGRVLLVIAVVLMIIAVWTSRVHFEAKDGEASQSGGNEGEITGETVIPSVGGLTPGPTVPGVPAAIDGESKGSI